MKNVFPKELRRRNRISKRSQRGNQDISPGFKYLIFRFYSLGCLSSCHLRGKKGRREVVFDQVAGGRWQGALRGIKTCPTTTTTTTTWMTRRRRWSPRRSWRGRGQGTRWWVQPLPSWSALLPAWLPGQARDGRRWEDFSSQYFDSSPFSIPVIVYFILIYLNCIFHLSIHILHRFPFP